MPMEARSKGWSSDNFSSFACNFAQSRTLVILKSQSKWCMRACVRADARGGDERGDFRERAASTHTVAAWWACAWPSA
eukprot:5043531-Prymnesium_polylepis.1